MLDEVGIQSRVSDDNRSRRRSNKDIHSLRHTFCYIHGLQGTSLAVVRSMVGHMDDNMTRYYMMHQTEELKREAIKRFSLKPFEPISLKSPNTVKQQLIDIINDTENDETLKKMLEAIQTVKKEEANKISGWECGGNHGGTLKL